MGDNESSWRRIVELILGAFQGAIACAGRTRIVFNPSLTYTGPTQEDCSTQVTEEEVTDIDMDQSFFPPPADPPDDLNAASRGAIEAIRRRRSLEFSIRRFRQSRKQIEDRITRKTGGKLRIRLFGDGGLAICGNQPGA